MNGAGRARPDLASLAARAREGKARFALLFGGQGTGWFAELQEYYRDPGLRPFVDRCIAAMREELPHLEPDVALPLGFEVDAWLADESRLPSREYVGYCGVSVPLTFVTQLACLRNLGSRGFPLEELLERTHAISGQSQGLFPAALVALRRSGGIDDDATYRFVKYVFCLATRCQEVYPLAEPSEEERARAAAASAWRSGQPTPMAAVVDATDDELEQRLCRFNRAVPAADRVQLGLRLASGRAILSGHRGSLLEFNVWNRAYFGGDGVKFVFLPTTCPFHSTLMEPVRARADADIARLRFTHPGSELEVPVYSFYDGRNLQDDEDVAIELYLDATIRPLVWSRALAPLVDADGVTHVLDFGPGVESRHLARRALEELGCRAPVVSARSLCRSTSLKPSGRTPAAGRGSRR